MTYANDETLVGVAIDWPPYEATGNLVDVLSVDEIAERFSAVGKTQLASPQCVTRLWFECGYFDAGVHEQGTGESAQPACIATFKEDAPFHADAPRPVAATLTVMPIAREVMPHPYWPESLALSNSADVCEGSPLNDIMDVDASVPGSGPR